jgi:hypothetical protein
MTTDNRVTHGLTRRRNRHPLYGVWSSMKARCYRPCRKDYKYYGAKGVTVSSEWVNSFEQFVLDMGAQWFAGAHLDRIDPDGPYSKENCRFVCAADNIARKRKPKARKVTPEMASVINSGLSYKELMNRFGISQSTIISVRAAARKRGIQDELRPCS